MTEYEPNWERRAKAAERELEAVKSHLLNLLAVIHRDGGHHTDAMGIEQSVQDAKKVSVERIAALEREKMLREAAQSYLIIRTIDPCDLTRKVPALPVANRTADEVRVAEEHLRQAIAATGKETK